MALLLAYGPTMALVLVWAGEHYVMDPLLGAAYASGIALVAAHTRSLVLRHRAPARVPAPTVGA